MPRVLKPDPPTYNGHKLTPSERRAILAAAAKGYVFRAGKLGSGAKDSPQHKNSYVSVGVLRKLYKAGVMMNGTGYGTYCLTQEYKSQGLSGIRQYDELEAVYLSDRAARKAAAEQRKAMKQGKAPAK
jgi:hypothetical protein